MTHNPYTPPGSLVGSQPKANPSDNSPWGNCSACGIPLDRHYHTPICPTCYTKQSSTTELPEIEASIISRNLGLISLVFMVLSNLLYKINSAQYLIYISILFSIILSIISIIFFFISKNKVIQDEPRCFTYKKAGLFFASVVIFQLILGIAIGVTSILE